MKRDLVIGWINIICALAVAFLAIIGYANDYWSGVCICSFSFMFYITNAVIYFRNYKEHKKQDKLDLVFRECWPDEDNH